MKDEKIKDYERILTKIYQKLKDYQSLKNDKMKNDRIEKSEDLKLAINFL